VQVLQDRLQHGECIARPREEHQVLGEGHPLLAGIDFTSVGSDQSALDALQSGEGQLAMGVSTIPLLNSVAKQGLIVDKLPCHESPSSST